MFGKTVQKPASESPQSNELGQPVRRYERSGAFVYSTQPISRQTFVV